MATRFPSSIDTVATRASTGTQPRTMWGSAAVASAPANPRTASWKKMKKLATLEADAMNAALGAGGPRYASGALKWNGAPAPWQRRPMVVGTMAMTMSGLRDGPWMAPGMATRLVELE